MRFLVGNNWVDKNYNFSTVVIVLLVLGAQKKKNKIRQYLGVEL